MKKSLVALFAASVALAFVVSAGIAEDKPAEKVTKVKCPVAGKEIKIADAKCASYRDANVYVCCNGCKGKVEDEPKKFAVKANHQLVVTKQFKQVKCPLSGGPINKDKTSKVGGQSVGLCCGKCKSAVDGAEGDKKLAMVFGDKAFDKGFKAVEKKK